MIIRCEVIENKPFNGAETAVKDLIMSGCALKDDGNISLASNC